MGPKDSACKSGLTVKLEVVKSEKSNIVKTCKNWNQSIPAAKSKMMLNQVPIKQQSTVKQKSQKNKDSNT